MQLRLYTGCKKHEETLVPPVVLHNDDLFLQEIET